MSDTKYKAIVFDIDHSLTTLGGPKRQEEVFGLPPISHVGGLGSINKVLSKLLVKRTITKQHELLGDYAVDEVIDFSDKLREAGVNMMIIDTITMLGTQERTEIIRERTGDNKNKLESLDQQGWGIYGARMEKFINFLSKCNFPVIITGHVNREPDEFGRPIEYPDIKGSTKTSIGRYFDVILYSKVNKSGDGNATYTWITKADSRYLFAKNRGNYLEPIIDQNLSVILSKYKENGINAPKILILGDTGNGKSWSLQTINNK